MPEQMINLGGGMDNLPKVSPLNIPSNEVPLTSKTDLDSLFLSNANRSKSSNVQDIPVSSFSYGDRYNTVIPFTNPEEMYGQQQSSLSKWGNGLVKMTGLAGTFFVSGTVGLLNGIANSITENRFSSLFDNETTRNMDKFSNRYLENKFPNYYTEQESSADWYSPKNFMTANFWADKTFKNLGYSLGAIAGGVAWSSLFKNIGLINAATKAGLGMEEAAALENTWTTVPRVEQYKAASSILEGLKTKIIAPVLKDSERILTSTMGTFGEASIGALQNMNTFRNNLIADFTNTHGYSPTDQDLTDINNYADKVGNYTWGMNTLLLTATNYVSLPKILGSSRKIEKSLINSLEQQGKEFVPVPKNYLIKTKDFSKLFFAPSEAFEEGVQYAIQQGINDYFNRNYKNKENVDSFWESMIGATKNVFTKGIEDTLNSKEGLESILIGGISGGLQQSGIVGTYKQDGKTKFGIGKSGTIGEQGIFGTGGERKVNTEIALQALNKTNISKVLQDNVNYINRSITTQQLRQEAIANGDTLNEKDYEHDYTMSYILPRVKYGKEDSIYNELELYKQQASSNQGFSELQNSGIALQNETSFTFLERLAKISSLSKEISENYSKVNNKYSGIFKDGERVYSDEIIDKMVYAASKVSDYDQRIPELSKNLLSKGIIITPALQGILGDEVSLKGLGEALAQIQELNVVSDEKDELKQSLFDILELSSRRKLFLEEYDAIKKSPKEFSTSQSSTIETEKTSDSSKTIKIKTKDGEEDIEIGTEYYLGKVTEQSKEGKEFYRFPKLTILRENEDGTIRIKSSEGNEKDITKEQLIDYKLGKVSDTNSNKKAKFFLKILNNLHKEVTEQLEKSKSSLEEKQKTLESVQGELNSLSEKIKEGDLTKKNNFKASTNRAIKSANKLSRLQENIRLEIESLQSEQEQLEINKAYIEDTIQNIDELPTDSKDFIEELENQVLDLQILYESTGKQLNLLSKLQDKIEDTLDTTISFLKDLVRKFTNKYPNVPTSSGQEWVDFIKSNPKFLKLKPSFKDDLKELEITIAETEDFFISPDEDKLKEIKEDITSILNTLKDLEKELKAKELIADRFVSISEEYKRQKEEKIKLANSEEIRAEIEKQQTLLDNNTNLGTSEDRGEYEVEPRKTLQVFINSTSSPTDSYSQPFKDIIRSKDLDNSQKESKIDAEIADQELNFKKLPEHIQRERTFLNSLSPKDALNYETIVVSPKNAHHLGLEDMFKTFYPTGGELNKGNDIDESPIYTIYIKIVNGSAEYIKQDGTSTGIKVDQKNDFSTLKDIIVFSTLAKVATTNVQAKLSSREEEAYEKTGREQHRRLRKYYLEAPKPISTSFTVSQGFRIPSVSPKPLSSFIEKEYDENSSILIGEGNELIGANKEAFTAKLGHVYYRGSQTIPLSNRKFTKEEQVHIQKVLTAFINQLITPNAQKDSDLMTNSRVFLEGVLYFQRPKEGKTPTKFQIYTNPATNTLNFGDKQIPFYSINSTQAQSEIASFLATVYNNINLKKLTKNETFVSDPFNVETSNKQNYYEYIRDNDLLVAQVSKKSINGNTAFGKYAILNSKPVQDTTIAPVQKQTQQAQPTGNVDIKSYVGKTFINPKTGKEATLLFDGSAYILESGNDALIGKNPFMGVVNFANLVSTGRIVLKETSAPQQNEDKTINDYVGIEFTNPKNNKTATLKQEGTSYVLSNNGPILGASEVINERQLLKYIDKGLLVSNTQSEIDEQQPELAEHKKVDVEQSNTSTKKSFTFKKDSLDELSVIDDYDVERMSEEEKKAFKSFIKKNLPQFTPLEVEEIINATNGRKAWGKLEDNMLVFYKNARKGTGYHEAFEGVWKYLTSQEDKSAILTELREKKGEFFDRVSEENISFSEATDHQLKEYLADSFADYINTPKTFSSKIKAFFDRIVKFFRSFLAGYKKNASLVDELFSKIEAGKLKKIKINTSGDTEYSFAPKGWTVRSTKLLVDNIVILYFNEILKQNKSFFDTKTYEDPAIWSSIKNFLLNNSDSFGEPEVMNEVLERTKLKLKTLGIQFEEAQGEEDKIKILDDNKTSEYNDDKLTLSIKKSSPFPIKFMLSSLFEVTDLLNPQGMPQAKKDEETNMLLSFPFSKAFIQILEATYKADSYDDTISKLKDLIEKYPVYERVLAWMTNSKDLNISNIDVNSLQMLNAFYKTFNKQNPGAFAIQQYGDEVVMTSLQHANATDAKEEWRNRLFYTIRGNQNPLIIKSNKNYVASEELKEFPIKESTVISFLNNLGVDISLDTYNSLTDKNKFKIIDLSQKIKNVLLSLNVRKLEKDSLKINGPLESIARIIVPHIQETTFSNGEGERQQRFIQHNVPSVFTHILNNVKTKKELLDELPYLNSPFAANSIIWNTYFNEDGTRNDIKSNIGYIENVFGKYRSTDSTDLDYNQRLSSYLNGQLYGFTEISVAADASIPWNMTLPQLVKFSEFRTKTLNYEDKIYNYFLDEIALSKTNNKAVNLANKSLSKELRFFKDVTSINASKSQVLNDFEKYVVSKAEDLKQQLINENELIEEGEGIYSMPSILTEWFRNNHFTKNREDEYVMTEEQVTQFLKTSIINSFSSQVEFHKLFIGDPYLYKFNKEKGKFDETKRVKSLLSPANPSLISDIYNKVWYNDINKDLTSNTLGYIEPKDALTFSVLNDVNIRSIINTEQESNEADAQALHSLGMDIDFRSRQGILFEDQKDWYKWDCAVARTELSKKYPNLFSYSSEQKNKDVKIIQQGEPKLKNKFTPIKPIVRGNEWESKQSKTILHKISSYPLSYALAKGKGLEDIYLKMFKEKIDYLVMESGAKVGTDALNDLYEKGKVNTTKFKTQKVGWDAYYNQVENIYSDVNQTLGSQNTKLNTQDFFENGIIKDESVKNAIQNMNDALNTLTQERFNELLKEIGVNKDNFDQADKTKLRKKLLKAATTRSVPYNIIEALKDETYPIESLPNYVELQNVLMSLVRDAIVSMEVNGAPHVQIAATGFENLEEGRSYLYHNKETKTYTKATSEQIEQGKNLVMSSSHLKIPTKESPYMEVMIPMWFRNLLKGNSIYKNMTDEQVLEELNSNPSILQAIGFRIPTQAMSSISPIKIAGFLPEAYGKTVVVPSELTAIAGSDFDIDKLNMYLKNLYIDNDGKLQEIPEFSSFEEAKKFIIKYNIEDLLKNYSQEEETETELTKKDFERDEKDNFRFYLKSLENKYFNNMIKVLTSPYNLEALVTPLDSPILKELSAKMQSKLGVNKEISLLDISTPQGISKIRTLFMMAKKWVGIGALGITGHSQFQQYGGYIDTTELGDFSLISTLDNKIPMGNILNQDGQKISNVLSWLISSYVDVAKDEYITHLIYDKRIVGTVTAMVRMGLPLNTIFDFVNQPIIRDLVQYARLNGYTNLSNQFLEKKFLKDNAKYRSRKIPTSFSKSNLSLNIGKEDVDVNEQRAILNEFKKFFEISQALREFTSSTNWDTVRVKNTALLTKRQKNWEKVQNGSIVKINPEFFISSRPAIIQSLYKIFVEEVVPSISPLQSLEFQEVVNNTLTPYFDEFMDEKELEKLADNIQKSLINYLIQSKTPLTNTLKSLDEYSTSLINKFDDPKYNGLQIKTLLEIKDNMVFLKPYPTEVFEKDVVAGALEELREFEEVDGIIPEDSLYKRLLRFGLVQGAGNYNSLLSYVNMEDLKALTANLPQIKTNRFTEDKLYAKNNWKKFPTLSLRVISENKQAHIATWGRRGYKLTPLKSNGMYNDIIKNRVLSIPSSKKDAKLPFFKTIRIASASNTSTKEKGYYDIVDNVFVSSETYNALKAELNPILKEYVVYEKIEENSDVSLFRQTNVYGNNVVSEYPLISNQPSSFDNGSTRFSLDEILSPEEIFKNIPNYFLLNDNEVSLPKEKITFSTYSKLLKGKEGLTEQEFNSLPKENQKALIYQLENC